MKASRLPLGQWFKKNWGWTKKLFENESSEVHLIKGGTGGCYSSEHVHEFKVNMFHVIQGKMLIRVWKESGHVDETILEADQSTSVDPGLWHQMEFLEDETMALEIYNTPPIHEDIVRRSDGGCRG